MPLYGPPLDKPNELHNLLRHGLETKPDEAALVSAEARWSWRELDRARVGYKAPDEIIVLSEMPLNPAGKVDRTKLKKWAEEQTHPLAAL